MQRSTGATGFTLSFPVSPNYFVEVSGTSPTPTVANLNVRSIIFTIKKEPPTSSGLYNLKMEQCYINGMKVISSANLSISSSSSYLDSHIIGIMHNPRASFISSERIFYYFGLIKNFTVTDTLAREITFGNIPQLEHEWYGQNVDTVNGKLIDSGSIGGQNADILGTYSPSTLWI